MTLENRNDEREARITAYAFGELEGEALAAMEAEVAADPALAARVAELRGFGDDLGAALAEEPVPAMFASAPERGPRVMDEEVEPRGRVVRFPAWAWAATGMAAAAGVAMLVWLRGAGDGVTAPDDQGRGQDVVAVEPPPPPAPMPEREPALLPAPLEAEAPRVANTPTVEAPMTVVAHEVKDVAPTPEPAPESSLPLMVASAEPVIEIPTNTLPPPVSPAAVDLNPDTQVRAMLDKGRSQYVAGDLAAAAAAFDAVMKANSRNREARYFSARIAQERAGGGTDVEMPAVARQSTPLTQGRASAKPLGAPRATIWESPFVATSGRPVSTFSPDVDASSYLTLKRRVQARSGLGFYSRDAVRIEELINFFPYDYASPPTSPGVDSAGVFSAHLAVASAPWAPKHRLVRVGLKAVELAHPERPSANIVFVVDFSGSSGAIDGMPRAKLSLLRIVDALREDDRVAIVTFGGAAQLTMPSTLVTHREAIRSVIQGLKMRGFTPAKPGIRLAYDVARENFKPELVNRVILCTEGSAGIAFPNGKERDDEAVFEFVREQARGGVRLSVIGQEFFAPDDVVRRYGKRLAASGGGVFAPSDSPREARRIILRDIDGQLATAAEDMNVRVEFNPDRVGAYRLIGYENPQSPESGAGDENIEAREIVSGHAITALYEIEPTGKRVKKRPANASSVVADEDRLLTVKIRYKDPFNEEAEAREQEFALADAEVDFKDADEDFRFAASVAAWGMLLRESPYKGNADLDDVRRWAKDSLGDDPGGYREEFIELVKNSRPSSVPVNRF